MNFGSSSNEAPRPHTPFEKHKTKDITEDEVEEASQDPNVAQFMDKIVALYPQRFLA